MPLSVYRVTEYSDALLRSLGTLLPQLSPRLGTFAEARLRAMLAHPATALFVAEAEERIVGMLTLAWYDAPSGRKAWIEDVVVDAAARGSGAGEALVRAALERARREEADCVMLTSSAARTAARSLYRKVGFVEAETSVFTLKREKI